MCEREGVCERECVFEGLCVREGVCACVCMCVCVVVLLVGHTVLYYLPYIRISRSAFGASPLLSTAGIKLPHMIAWRTCKQYILRGRERERERERERVREIERDM